MIIVPTTTPTRLSALKSLSFATFKALQLQAPSANAAVINYGSTGAASFELAAGATTRVLPCTNTNDLYLSGNGTDSVRILIFS